MACTNFIAMTITIDKAGRLVLPKEIRVRLHLVAGDILEAELGVNEVLLRPRQAAAARVTRLGARAIWDAPGSGATVEEIENAVQRGRSERDARASGL
jgi:AbrB family looped-hinge helix DNA binding protein